MDSSEPAVMSCVRNRVGHLTLNRPSTLNALNLAMVRILLAKLREWQDDPEVLAIVVRGAGERAFCAGGDIRMLYESHAASQHQHQLFLEEEYALDRYLHDYPKPVVAIMDGLVLGGGMGLAQAASMRVVTERSRLGMPEVAIGFFPDVGGSHFLSRLAGELGTYLGITGLQVRAADALYADLADVCIPSASLNELDFRLDTLEWSRTPDDDLLRLLMSMGADRLPGSELRAVHRAIDQHFAARDMSTIYHSLQAESRPEFHDWAEETLRVLDNRSPLAMSITLEQVRRGRHLSLSDCFSLELHLAQQMFDRGDVMEGIRALLIDKDKAPRWNPSTLAEVSQEHVLAFFSGFHPTVARFTARVTEPG